MSNAPDRRPCELWVERGYGSGYAVAPTLVLTSRHVVDAALGERWQVRSLGGDEWVPGGEVVWTGDGNCDAALVRVPTALPVPSAPIEFGRFHAADPQPFRAVGFPDSQKHGTSRDVEAAVGEIAPLTAFRQRRLALDVTSALYDQSSRGGSPWEGLSGAAVISLGLVVGVVAVSKGAYDGRRLEAVLAEDLLASPAFAEAFTVSTGTVPRVVAVENADVPLRRPYLPLPSDVAPSLLLRPEYGVVPFAGRADSLSELQSWAAGLSGGTYLASVTGAGGTGKSRLAAELSSRLEQTDQPWLTGFLGRGADAAAWRRLASSVGPLLVVVDDADSRIDEIANVLAALDRGRPADTPTAVVLVGRVGADRWVAEIREHDDGTGAAERAVPGPHVELGPLPESNRDRAALFASAVAAFTERLDAPARPAAPPTDLGQELFGAILFIHLAALTALDGDRRPADAPIGRWLVEDAVARESRYWTQTGGRAGIVDRDVRRRAVALATMVHAHDEQHAAELLRALPDLSEEPLRARLRVARWLASLYPREPDGDRWIGPLRPDLLGEALVAEIVNDVPDLLPALVTRFDIKQAGSVWQMVNEAAKRSPTLVGPMRRAIDAADGLEAGDATDRWKVVVIIAMRTGAPLPALIVESLQAKPRPELAMCLALDIEFDNVILRPVTRVVLEQALTYEVKAAVVEVSEYEEQVLQVSFLKYRLLLATVLADDGQLEEAVAILKEGAVHGRLLHEQGVEGAMLLLTAVLAAQATYLRHVGRLAERECVNAELRALAGRSDEGVASDFLEGEELPRAERLRHMYDKSLQGLGEVLADSGSADDVERLERVCDALMQAARLATLHEDDDRACTFAELAVGGYEALLDAGQAKVHVPLADALALMSAAHHRQARHDEARELQERAVALRRAFALLVPGEGGRALGRALATLGSYRLSAGDAEAAREAAREATAVLTSDAADDEGAEVPKAIVEARVQARVVEAEALERLQRPMTEVLALGEEAWATLVMHNQIHNSYATRVRSGLCLWYLRAEQHRQAVEHAVAALQMWEQVDDVARYADERATVWECLAQSRIALHEYALAAEAAAQGVAFRRALDELAGAPPSRAFARALTTEVDARTAMGDGAEIAPLAEELLNVRLDLAQDGDWDDRWHLAEALRSRALVGVGLEGDVLGWLAQAVRLRRDLALAGQGDPEQLGQALLDLVVMSDEFAQPRVGDKAIAESIAVLSSDRSTAAEAMLRQCEALRDRRAAERSRSPRTVPGARLDEAALIEAGDEDGGGGGVGEDDGGWR